MRMLFIHDNKFWKHGNEYYSYGHFDYNLLWKRYLRYFDEIDVGGRIIDNDDPAIAERLSKSSGEGVSFFSLPNLMSVAGLKHYGEAKKCISEHMKEADCVVVRLPSNLGYVASGVARSMKKKCVTEVVGCTWDDLWNYGTIAGKLYAPVSFLFERRCVRRAENVMYVSRKFLQKRYPSKGLSIGCADTNLEASEGEVLEQRIRKIRSMNENNTVRLGLIASLSVGYKGHDTAILALQEVIRSHNNVRVCFLGDGDSLKWEKLAEDHGVRDHVDFCGSIPGGKPVLEWLDNIDIFLMPSLQETLGRALIEAMSRACPAIGGDGTAVPEQLSNDCIHARKDYHELAQMICYMIEHPKYMELCAIENFERSKKYSEDILSERRDYFWHSVLG